MERSGFERAIIVVGLGPTEPRIVGPTKRAGPSLKVWRTVPYLGCTNPAYPVYDRNHLVDHTVPPNDDTRHGGRRDAPTMARRRPTSSCPRSRQWTTTLERDGRVVSASSGDAAAPIVSRSARGDVRAAEARSGGGSTRFLGLRLCVELARGRSSHPLWGSSTRAHPPTRHPPHSGDGTEWMTKLRKIPSQFLVRASDREDARRATESIAI